MKRIILSVVVCCLGGCASALVPKPAIVAQADAGEPNMRLGNFLVSLAVKDLAASRAFYEKLGFRQVAGNPEKNWLVLRNGMTKIGLFQGMFDKNMLTFNPGWNYKGDAITDFDDVRDLQRRLKSRGITPAAAADEGSTGPASCMVIDPDGNPVLVDQHVPSPRK
jgi:catechol 2,3-dioxygenase-like lactoylglutathione lyase family enzyme